MEKYNLDRDLVANREKRLIQKELSEHYEVFPENHMEELKRRIAIRVTNMKRASELVEDRSFDASKIMDLPDLQFVENLYQGILLRAADDGKFTYVKALMDGSLNRKDIVETISKSEEGQIMNVAVKGLEIVAQPSLKLHGNNCLVERIPVLRYFFKWVKSIVWLPRNLSTINRRLEEIEHYKSYGQMDIFELQWRVEQLNRKILDIKNISQDILSVKNDLVYLNQQVEIYAKHINDIVQQEWDVREQKKREQLLKEPQNSVAVENDK